MAGLFSKRAGLARARPILSHICHKKFLGGKTILDFYFWRGGKFHPSTGNQRKPN
jgi:hypothetical protein